jgi:hypothetical protein
LKLGDPGYAAGQTRGIIASFVDLSTGAEWGCIGATITGADGLAIGTGNQNTTDIMAGCTTVAGAAKLCNDLVLGGYDDWYLPSKDELNKLYINQSVIGGFSLFNYWSSTESSNNEALLQNFTSGNQQVGYKDGNNYVRAVRAFPSVPVLPAITTTAATSITSTTATSGGNILSDGGASVTDRGVCWNTSTSPVATGNHISKGNGTGVFSGLITGLTPNTIYYVRAYATNSAGTAYSSEQIFRTAPVEIGVNFQGGIMAYVLQPGDPGYISGQTHGLIVASTDQGFGNEWGCSGIFVTGADGTAIGTGNQNTIDIENSGCAVASAAARVCFSLDLGGYSDWYLPSKDELNLLFINRVAIGGFSSYTFWSSTESSDNQAWGQSLSVGNQFTVTKTTPCNVRAVRSF